MKIFRPSSMLVILFFMVFVTWWVDRPHRENSEKAVMINVDSTRHNPAIILR